MTNMRYVYVYYIYIYIIFIFEDELRNMFFYPKVCMCKNIFQIIYFLEYINWEEKYSRIYVHIRENAYFQTLHPKGAVSPPIDICPPQLLAEYVQYHFINSTDIYSSIVGSLHAMQCAVCSVYCHFPSLYSLPAKHVRLCCIER